MMHDLSDFYFEDDIVKDLLSNVPKTTFNAGKHFRTTLMNQIGECFGLSCYQMSPYTRVIELVHNATLLHDDVIDNSFQRRGVPTLNASFDNKSCILVGDYMLAKALFELSSFSSAVIVKELTRTLKDLVSGELIQDKENNNIRWSIDAYRHIAYNKTGSLLRWCLITPLMIKEVNDKLLFQELEFVAHELGMIYQILDDIKDFTVLEKKSPFLDLINGNINFVLINLQNESINLFEKLCLKKDFNNITLEDREQLYQCIKNSLLIVDQKIETICTRLHKYEELNSFTIYIKEVLIQQQLEILKKVQNYDFKTVCQFIGA